MHYCVHTVCTLCAQCVYTVCTHSANSLYTQEGMAGVVFVQVDKQCLCLGGLRILTWPSGGMRTVRRVTSVAQHVLIHEAIQLCVTYADSVQLLAVCA